MFDQVEAGPLHQWMSTALTVREATDRVHANGESEGLEDGKGQHEPTVAD